MSQPGRASELVGAEKLRHPEAVELATSVSLAVQIEPELLRAMRIAVAPRLDAAAEADLWFGPLVRLRGPDGITLHADVAEVLRNRLKERWQNPDERHLVERAWRVTQRIHQDASPALVLEERVTWFVLSGDLHSAEAELDRAVKALATGAVPGITGWFSQAWGRMPAEARGTRAGWLLHHASGRPGPMRIQPATVPDDLLAHDLSLALSEVGDVELGVHRDGDVLLLGDIGDHHAAAILVPETEPRIVEIRWPDEARPRAELISLSSCEVVSRAAGTGRLQLRTARGMLYELAAQAVRRYFIAVGIGEVQDLSPLDNIAREVRTMTDLFTQLGYEHVLPELDQNPTREQLLGHLGQWLNDPSRQANDVVVLFLTGHSQIDQEQFFLYTADSSVGDTAATAVAAAQLGRIVASSRAGPVLVILDACFAERGIEELARASGRELWAIGSARHDQMAEVGAFVKAFREALDDEALGVHEVYLAPDALVSVINQRLTGQQASLLAYGVSGMGPFLPNPRYDPAFPQGIDLESQRRMLRQDLRQHWVPAARGVGNDAEPGSYFTGRRQVLAELVAFLTTTEPLDRYGPRVVTGSPGSGKSAVLGRLAVLADPSLRAASPLSGSPPETIPPPGIIDIAISARGKGLAEIHADLATVTGLTDQSDIADPGRLLAAIRAHKKPLVVILDALDEATEPQRIAHELLRPLADSPDVRLVVGTRLHFVGEIGPNQRILDLDSPPYLSLDDLSEYAKRLLLADDHRTGATPYRANPELAGIVAAAVAARAAPSFLAAQIAARTLSAQPTPLDVTSAGWRERLPATAGAAFDEYLVSLGPDERRARDLLTPLAYAEGAGLPRYGGVWEAIASAFAEEPSTDADIAWLLGQAGHYLVEGVERGRSAYRLFHPALADHLRRPAGEQHAQRAITEALIGMVPRGLDGVRTWLAAPPYIRSHLAAHAAAAGILATLLEDPEYVLFADPGRLREAEARMAGTDTSPPTGGQSTGRRVTGARIVAVPGLGQTLTGPNQLYSLFFPALQGSLELADAEPIAAEDLAVAFYGDCFRLPGGAEDDGHDEEDLEEGLEEEVLVSLWRAAEPSERGPEPKPGAGRTRIIQRALRALTESRFFAGLAQHVVVADLKQIARYMQEPALRRTARARVADTIGPGTRVVIAHSIGSIVAYETLCAHPEWDVRMFITFGSPLGIRNVIFDRLDPRPHDGIGSWPGSVRRWVNIADQGDIVALEKGLNPMFAGPVEDLLVDNGAQAHNFARYLLTSQAGRAVADGLVDRPAM